MKFFFRYIFPVIFGLVIYTSLRLVNDVISGTQFWKRHWTTNAIEVTGVIIISYIFSLILQYFVNRFSKQTGQLTRQMIIKEFLTVLFYCLLVLNATAIPL